MYKKYGIARAQVEHSRAENRRKDFEREDNLKRMAKEKILRANLESDERVENKRYVLRLQREQQEMAMQYKLESAERTKLLKEKQLKQETRLAMELEKIKWKEEREKRIRHQLKENSSELRELESKLRAGYMNKERAVQMLEKEAEKEKEKIIEARYAAMLEQQLEIGHAFDTQQEEQQHQQMLKYQAELEQQLAEQEKKKQELYEEFLKEKLMIDEICMRIYDEDQKEIEAKLEKQRATRKYIEDFKRKREEWRAHEKEQLEEENRKILEFAQQQEAREETRKVVKKQQEDAIAAVYDKLSNQITEKRAQDEEMERIIAELYEEEQREYERSLEKVAIEAQLRQRLELQNAHRDYLEIKALKAEAMKEEEAEFRRQMMEKFAEDDRIEQMNAQKRRMKQLEHRRAVENLIDERRAQFLRQKEQELEERQAEEKAEAERRAIIEQERRRLLREHASKLLGYLPKGVIRSSSDVDLLGKEFEDAYRSRAVDPLDEI